MKQLIEKKYFVIIYSLLLNTLFMVACLLFVEQGYDMPDASQYPVYISNGYYTFGFLNYFFCVICGALQSIIYPFSAYVVLQVVFSFFAMTVVSVVFLQKYNVSAATFAILLLNSCYAIFQYTNISFTVFPALLGVSGILCIVHFSRREKWIAGVIVGIILMILNVMFRIAVTEAVLFIGFFYVLGLSLSEYFSQKKENKKIKNFFLILFERKRFFSFLVAIILCFSMHFISNAVNNATPELRYYNEYTAARSAVWDYAIPSYDTCQEKYDTLGINANDLAMFKKGYMDDEGATPLSVLKGMKQIQQEYNDENKSFADVFKSMAIAIPSNIFGKIEPLIGYFSFGLTTLLLLVFMKMRRWWIPICLGIAMFILLFYLHFIGRTPYRTVHMIWISALVYMLYSYSYEDLRDCFKCIYIKKRRIALIILIVISVAFSPLVFYVSNLTRFTLTTYSAQDDTAELRKYIADNQEKKFVFSRASGLANVEDNVHYIVQPQFKNTIYFTATYYRYDGYEAEVKQFGHHNLYESLLNKDVYWIDSDTTPDIEKMKLYLQKYYAKNMRITFRRIKSFDGQSVYQFDRQ